MRRAVVIGSTLSGMRRAAQYAQDGFDVILIASGTYLMQDVTETWRYWARDRHDDLLSLLQETIELHSDQIEIGDLSTPVEIKRFALKWMQCARVEVRYMTHFIGLTLGADRSLSGVLVADKFGAYHLSCQKAWDGTMYGEATALAASGPIVFPQKTKGIARFEWFSRDVCEAVMPNARILQGAMSKPHKIVEVDYELLAPMNMPQVREYVLEKISETARMLPSSDHSALGKPFGSALPLSMDLQVSAKPSIRVLGWNEGIGSVDKPVEMLISGKHYPYAENDGRPIFDARVLRKIEGDVCVAGLGTAGAWAAVAAQRNQAEVICVNDKPYPGGTRTLSGVSGLYYGNRNRLFAQQWNEIRDYASEILGESEGTVNPVSEMMYYESQIRKSIYLPCSVVFDAIVRESKLDTLLVAGEQGLIAIHARQFIDATGDGDIAAKCGVEYTVGDPELGVTQNYSQWNRCDDNSMGRRSIDQDTMDPTQRSEWARCLEYNIMTAQEYDLYDQIGVRETRRIHGRMKVTSAHVMRESHYYDVLCEAYSTYDPHSRSMGILGRLGLMPALAKARFVSIPLRAVLVSQVDNMMVAGKAISFDQDAFNYIRMSSDVKQLGWIEGRLAANCAAHGMNPKDASLCEIQEDMRTLGVITYNVPTQDSDTVSIDRLCAGILCGNRSEFHEAMRIDDPQVREALEVLEKYIELGDFAQRTLLYYGNLAYANQVHARLEHFLQLWGEKEYSDHQNEHGVSRCGMVDDVPDPYWEGNQLAVLLSKGGYIPAISTITRMMEETPIGNSWVNDYSAFAAIRLDCQTLPNYDRLLCLAACADLMPCPEYSEPLLSIYSRVEAIPIAGATFYREYLLFRIAHAISLCNNKMALPLFKSLSESKYFAIRKGAKPKSEK